jgi:hypothetical protein
MAPPLPRLRRLELPCRVLSFRWRHRQLRPACFCRMDWQPPGRKPPPTQTLAFRRQPQSNRSRSRMLPSNRLTSWRPFKALTTPFQLAPAAQHQKMPIGEGRTASRSAQTNGPETAPSLRARAARLRWLTCNTYVRTENAVGTTATRAAAVGPRRARCVRSLRKIFEPNLGLCGSIRWSRFGMSRRQRKVSGKDRSLPERGTEKTNQCQRTHDHRSPAPMRHGIHRECSRSTVNAMIRLSKCGCSETDHR